MSSSGDLVADIRPMGRLQTVQVEVEPDMGRHDDEPEEEEERAEEEEERAEEQEEARPAVEQDQPVMDNPPESPKEEGSSQVSVTPTSALPSPPPPPTSTPVDSNLTPRAGASPLPHSTVAEGLDEAARRASASARKKPSKSKPLSMKDLMPLHQDVGKNTRQLAEPVTPDFKPTQEWVCGRTFICVCSKG